MQPDGINPLFSELCRALSILRMLFLVLDRRHMLICQPLHTEQTRLVAIQEGVDPWTGHQTLCVIP